MKVVSIQLRDFRSYARAEACLGAGLTVLHGPNGAGKSNLLEALYFGCTGHALRARNERELVRFGERTTRVVVHTDDGREQHELSVGYGLFAEGERPVKHMRADGAPVERLLDVESRPLVSVFLPDRLELIKGTPALRRAHLDALIAGLWPTRTATRRAYSRVLAQRNALLASIRAGRAARETLPSWDQELAIHAVALRADRAAAVARIAELFAERAQQLGLQSGATLEYRPRSGAQSPEEFVGELQERLAGELQRGFSSHGPHRDELVFLREGRELRTYGSQGEQRLALLALLLAERSVLAQERSHTPLMLLDDVMSELDSQRRELLAEELSSAGQSVIATTDLAHVPAAGDRHTTRLRISPGAVLREALAA
ncbi:MAG TPA: DNA replication and repair protein RecF [Solirubrobacteraceae bacterium]|nr:DNA replication and repair protein RecF [Solirubrobacteraceae bacterium]